MRVAPACAAKETHSLKVGPSCCSGAKEISGLRKFWHGEKLTLLWMVLLAVEGWARNKLLDPRPEPQQKRKPPVGQGE